MKYLFGILFWVLLLGGGYAAYDAHRFLNTPGSDNPQEIIFTIAPGATFDRVAWDLKKAGAVTDVPRFRLLAQYKDVLGKIRAGEFLVNTGWTPEQVLWQITMGQAVLYRLSIREGLTWWDTAKAVEEQGFATYEDFKEVIHDPAFLREHNIPFANAEGFLFPETYLLKKPKVLDKAQARAIASIMVNMFWKKTQPLWAQLPRKTATGGAGAKSGTTPDAGAAPDTGTVPEPRTVNLEPVPGSMGSPEGTAQAGARLAGNASEPLGQAVPPASGAAASPVAGAALSPAAGGATARPGGNAAVTPAPSGKFFAPLSPADLDPAALHHLIILASLVEKETGIPEERARVAGVYANRLRLNMLLQCDPTIIYGVGESFTGSIRRSQLNDAGNLYNTYQHPGLPPGPICSSGLDALKAAALPEKHEFLYFVATGIDGGHTFSKNLNDHNKAVQVYRSRMRGGQ